MFVCESPTYRITLSSLDGRLVLRSGERPVEGPRKLDMVLAVNRRLPADTEWPFDIQQTDRWVPVVRKHDWLLEVALFGAGRVRFRVTVDGYPPVDAAPGTPAFNVIAPYVRDGVL